MCYNMEEEKKPHFHLFFGVLLHESGIYKFKDYGILVRTEKE